MNLSMEIPTPHLEYFSRLCEQDFALAQLVLDDKTYAKFYRDQSDKGRRVYLDNGFHEMGHPLSVSSVLEAATLIDASVVICPDKFGDRKFTYEGYKEMVTAGGPFPLAVVLQGNDPFERAEFYEAVRKSTSVYMFPYKASDRPRRFREFLTYPRSAAQRSVHFLGVSTLQEIAQLENLSQVLDASYDTCKPFKLAYAEMYMTPASNLRGMGREKFKEPMTPLQREVALYNLALMRSYA